MLDTTGSDSRATSRRTWLAPALLFLVFFCIYALTISHARLSYDVYGANWTSWHLVNTGNPWIDGTPVPYIQDHHGPIKILIVTAQNGHTAFGRFPGVVAAGLPAYLVARGSGMSTVPGGLSAALLTAGTVTLMFLALRRHLRVRDAWLATAVFGLATPVWSVAANGVWTHTVTLLGIAGMAWASTTRRWWWVGIFGGIALWGRLHAVLIVAVLGLMLGRQRRDGAIVVRIALASGAFLVGYCAWVRWMYGTWSPTGVYGASGSEIVDGGSQYHFSVVNQLGMWVAPDRGILVWTPVVLLLVPALVRSWRTLPDWSRSLLVGGLVYTVIESALNTFTGGDAFYGYRYGLEMLACATPALALSARRMGPVAGRLMGPVLGVELLAFSLGATSDTLYLLEDQVWRDNAFVHAIDRIGVAGWVLVVLFAVGGALAGERWRRSDASRPESRTPESARAGSPA
jgi:alpha-1,2-mannosyltransferase